MSDITVFNPLRNSQTLLRSDCITVGSHQQCTGAQISPHPLQGLLLSVFDYSHPSGCEVASRYGFDLHFLSG